MSTTSSETPSGEILTIGTELLLGEILDTNTGEIARRLRRIGLDVYRTTTVGDNAGRIAAAMRQALGRAAVVITTGGLGPTIDDPTREAAAAALGVELVFHEELWAQIQDRFARFGRTPTENNRRQAFLPRGAFAIVNPVGTAPAFRGEADGRSLICLPGVPAEMQWLMEHEVEPFLRDRFALKASIFTRIVRVAGVGESWLDDRIRDLEEASDPTVGVLAHPGRVDIRIATKASDASAARRMLDSVQSEMQRRLGHAVYGVDEDTLEGVVTAALRSRGWKWVILEKGTDGSLATSPIAVGAVAEILPGGDPRDLEARLHQLMAAESAEAGLALEMETEGASHAIRVVWISPDGRQEWTSRYGGPPDYAGAWASSIALDHVRRQLG